MFAGSLDALTEHVKSVCSPGSMNGATVLNEESKIDNFPYKMIQIILGKIAKKAF